MAVRSAGKREDLLATARNAPTPGPVAAAPKPFSSRDVIAASDCALTGGEMTEEKPTRPEEGDHFRDVRQPYRGPALEISPVEVRPATVGEAYEAELRFEAELRGDSLISGDGGYWISVVGWGNTEDQAQASLSTALDDLRQNVKAITADEGR